MSVFLIVCALVNCQRYMEGCKCDGRSCSLVCAAVQLFKNRHAAVLVHFCTYLVPHLLNSLHCSPYHLSEVMTLTAEVQYSSSQSSG